MENNLINDQHDITWATNAGNIQVISAFKPLYSPKRLKVFYGGRGCVHGDTLIDTPDGKIPVKSFKGGEIFSITPSGIVRTMACHPVKYPVTELFEVEFANGSKTIATSEHRFLTADGWTTLSQIVCHDTLLSVCDHPQTISDTCLSVSPEGVPHYLRTILNYLYGYLMDCYQRDERLLPQLDTFQDILPLLIDEVEHGYLSHDLADDRALQLLYTLYPCVSHLSNHGVLPVMVDKGYEVSENCNVPKTFEQFCVKYSTIPQSQMNKDLASLILKLCDFFSETVSVCGIHQEQNLLTIQRLLQRNVDDTSYSDTIVGNCGKDFTTATVIRPVESDNYYDLFVPIFNNYVAEGLIHHNSGKSVSIAQALIVRAATKKTRILCSRELQTSIRESVHKLLAETIERMGLSDFFNIGIATIVGRNGSDFIFEGLKSNQTKIKGLQGVDIAWIEEAEAVTSYSWELLTPTIRKDDSEIWLSFNPFDVMDATFQKFVAPYEDIIDVHGFYEDDEIYVAKINYDSNPFFPQVLRAEMEKCKKENFNKYLHIWEGLPSMDFEDSLIQPEWIEASIDAHLKLNWKEKGLRAMGYDPADSGSDHKAYCVRHGTVVTHAHNWDTGDLVDGVEKAYAKAVEYGVTDICYDSVGIGAGAKLAFQQCAANSAMTLQPFSGAASVDNPLELYQAERNNEDMFRNLRAQYFWYLRDRFEKTYRAVEFGEYSDPEDCISLSSELTNLKLLRSELSRIQRKRGRSESQTIQIESKQDMKARGLASPNCADSLMYCFATKLKTDYVSPYDDWSISIN